MGSFFISRNNSSSTTPAEIKHSLESFEQQGFVTPKHIASENFDLYLFSNLSPSSQINIFFVDNNNFAFYTGVMFYKSYSGSEALENIFAECQTAIPNWDSFSDHFHGNFCLGICKNGILTLHTDRLGVYQVYCNNSNTVISNSFIATSLASTQRTINPQSVFEYVFEGAVFDNRTLFEEVSCLGGDYTLELNNNGATRSRLPCPIPLQIEDKVVSEHLEENLNQLRSYFKVITHKHSNKISTALSGGYDTRLLLALLLEQHVTPHLYVYGKSSAPDVVIAKLITKGEDLELEHLDKSQRGKISPEIFNEVINANFYFFDGIPPDSIIDAGQDLQTRINRYASGNLVLNGGGGGIYRNFNMVPDKKHTIRQYLYMFYSQFSSNNCSRLFSAETYYDKLETAVKNSLDKNDSKLSRCEIEALFPRLRFRYWLGRNTSTNCKFGLALTPFVDHLLTRVSNVIPIKYKNHGNFQGRLINATCPRIARYPSDYGHDFSSDAPLRSRIADLGTFLRPPLARKYTYNIKNHLRKPPADQNYLLGEDYLDTIINTKQVFLSHYFNIDNIKDVEQLQRIYTLEYFFKKIPPS